MSEKAAADELLFDVLTPLDFRVHCTRAYWERKVIADHPVMSDRVEEVIAALTKPEEVRLSRVDPGVYLFYTTGEVRLVWAVARAEGTDGFLITAYPTDRMKKGETVWKK
jgi:hypothetical protein